MLTTPIINNIKPFDATHNYDLTFNVYGGNQVTANRVLIEKVVDGTVVYNVKIESFQFKHSIPANTLQNGTQYRVKVKTYNINNEESEYSDSILFYCFSNPTVRIINIKDGLVGNSSYEFEGSYSQAENELAQSYRFYFYDSNEVLLSSSKEKFDSDFKYKFDGMENNEHYFVELKVYTVNGIVATSGLIPFDVNYYRPLFHTTVVLEDISRQASVKINARILNIEGQIGKQPISYEDGEWINLKDGMVYFDEENGFLVTGDFTLRMWLKDIEEYKEFLIMYSKNNVKLRLVYYKKRIHCFKEIKERIVSHYASNEIDIVDKESLVFIFFQSNKSRISIQAEVGNEERQVSNNE